MTPRRTVCRSLILAAAWTAVAAGARAADPEWNALFDGRTLSGWKPSGDAAWTVADEAIRTTGEQPGFLMHEAALGDFALHLEFLAAPGTNSGVFFSAVREPTDPTRDCYELNIAPPDNPFPTGSLVGRQRAAYAEGAFPAAERWHALDVTVVGRHWTVAVDGRTVLEYDDAAPLARRFVGLQSNQGAVAFRDIRLRSNPGE